MKFGKLARCLTSMYVALGIGLMLAPGARAQEKKPAQPEPPQQKPKATTLDHLMAAYEGDSNANARYAEFAKKADEEGYGQVASLFRATARAARIHASNHAEVIKKMGGTPKADIKKPEVKSTKENLEAALKNTNHEHDTSYPEFIKQAKEEKNTDALQTFVYAQAVEEGHAKLYKDALDHLDAWKGGKKDFYVCGVCGNTVVKIEFEKCPVCFSPKEKYEKVN
jgi:rubrerythrin